ncbi:HD-GYP domain-containing protein (c-di-GMP phosphodiesterase class II) [Desulfobaculum xiamenense]|uniref:HD-GYP domain-containing protein (C-di-GMP phosphodiesterase class II) n=1 Tax=Desulfobaculum xiamenense TaxID=995050 RepID=A0A846QG31_9BACT|nr:HD domain-containing phosphohydrolase [Desulfobaculum xiamenense]NJB67756.1 HD-GYP domain-containing protein (c-di-GMP phosphodiesterase class II) [Desulfobaculum xiamenense]
MVALKSTILDNLDEEYYQITPEILASFPKFRPPLNIYRLKEDTAQILIHKKAGERVDKDEQETLAELCAQGNIFLARSDHGIYSKHISKQLDLVLQDEHLKEGEIAEIFSHALTDRIAEFLEQPVKPVFDKLYTDFMVLTEYLWTDLNRIKAFTRRMHAEHTLPNHSFNSGCMGLWLFTKVFPGGFNRRVYDKVTVALFLHDMGMSKIPPFIREKQKPLTQDERSKVNLHPLVGSKLALKLGLKYDEMQQCVMEHHERLDGSGYPSKLRELSPLGRICAVADSYCAMISKRPYAEAMEPKVAVTELKNRADKYEPKYVNFLHKAVFLNDW